LADKVAQNKLKATTDYIERVSIRAIRVLEGQLDSEDERTAQAAAKDLLDRFLGKPTQRSELTGKDGGAIETETQFKVVDYRKTAAPLLTDEEDD
jgi:hypothetical protein